ncbi:MAG: tRNA (adenosine(37)-N6)-threonylcarbamoyltransferase complex dimerization subunit type 1 TsaB [Anaerolineae bacterium]|nr:tRNA (adenosine(37)-N6)-threonylcarbamoyltransferase complex dimerization subunit type 1 TsaB [Anaerolineae bacterium]
MLLAIDTATQYASIALHDGLNLRGEHTWEAVNRHTVTLLPNIVTLLESSGATAKDLDALAVCIGPGSFTGVRIGIAVAKGLALTQHLPVVGITTLDILAAAQPRDERPLYALLAAGRRRLGYARYRWQDEEGWTVETGIQLSDWTEFIEALRLPALVVGEIDSRGHKALDALGDDVTIPQPARRLRRAGFLADLAWTQLQKRLRTGESSISIDPAQLKPLYAR